MPIKVLVRRDSVKNFTTEAFIPREYEFVSAYDTESNKIIYKIGDGKTPWADLPKVTTIDEIDRFKVYSGGKEAIEMFLKPQSIQEFIDKNNGSNENGSENSDT